MAKLLNATSTVALWHDVIYQAENLCEVSLPQEVESYLVFLMIRYTATPDIVNHVMATDLLKGLQSGSGEREVKLQGVGDKCLIFSGLFPQQAEQRLVKISYFVNLGQSSYATLSREHNDLYWRLAHQFVLLMDVLQSLRQTSDKYPDLLPLQAYEQWSETGSQRAYTILKEYTRHKPWKQ